MVAYSAVRNSRAADVRFGSCPRHVRFTPKTDIDGRSPDVRFVPVGDLVEFGRPIKSRPFAAGSIISWEIAVNQTSFDYSIGSNEEGLWYCDAKRLCCLQIDHQLKPCRLHNG